MKEFSTQLDLILYIINELEKATKELSEELQRFTDIDRIREEKKIVERIIQKLENIGFTPSENVLKHIFDYSKASQIYKSKYCREIEIILN